LPEEVGRFRALSQGDRVWLASKVAFGLHSRNPATLWEVLPWSWFVDWIIPVQELLNTYGGLLPVYPRNVNVMTKTQTDFVFRNMDSNAYWQMDVPASYRRETKERVVLAPDGSLPQIAGGHPTIDLHRLGILASIRARRLTKPR
jgi:hypothetical protein